MFCDELTEVIAQFFCVRNCERKSGDPNSGLFRVRHACFGIDDDSAVIGAKFCADGCASDHAGDLFGFGWSSNRLRFERDLIVAYNCKIGAFGVAVKAVWIAMRAATYLAE